MNQDNQTEFHPTQTQNIRARAEKQVQKTSSEKFSEEPLELIHELRVHQEELRMQNEALQQSQNELLESNNRFSDLFNTAPVGYLICNEKGIIIDANTTVTNMTGRPRDLLIGTSLSSYAVSSQKDVFYLHCRNALKTSQIVIGELCLQMDDGRQRTLELQSIRSNFPKNSIRTALIDRTEQKILEQEIEQAQKMESIGRLAGGIAHDFNNIIMGILSYAQLCQNNLDRKHPVYKWILEISNEAQRSASLTRQLMAFARKQTISPRVVNLNTIIEKMINMLRRLIGAQVKLSWVPQNELWNCYIDPIQIDQILVNLCVNASDSIKSTGEIIIQTKNSVIGPGEGFGGKKIPTGEYVMLSIKDTGCGIAEEVQDKIFEPFFTTKRIGEGTGLGLSTVIGITEQNKGHIQIHSQLGKGTTFNVFIPRENSREVFREPTHTHSVSKLRGAETVLIAEDDEAIRETMSLNLKNYGYNVITADSAEKALDIALLDPTIIDLLITDIIMPGPTGKELSNRLLKSNPKLVTLYMSGYSADEISDRGILQKGVHFLQKPFSIKVLLKKVRECIDFSKTI